MEEWERKAHDRSRRAQRLSAEREGMDLRTRVVPAGGVYRRGFKHPPKVWEDWDSLD